MSYRIAIDIGHARHTGATGNGYHEHTQCAIIAAHLKHILQSYKVDPITATIIDYPDHTNTADLTATVRTINAGTYDAVISLHMDASDNPAARGAHVCYYSENGKQLAEQIALRLCPQLPGRASQTVKRTDLYILKHTRPTAVLIECGFITNPADAEWVDNNPDKVATPIALGIAAYLSEHGTLVP